MKRMITSAALLLWAGTAYADDRGDAVWVVGLSQYEESMQRQGALLIGRIGCKRDEEPRCGLT